jgi:hypothetical protein
MFMPGDIAELAKKAKLKLVGDTNANKLATALDWAFFAAHASSFRTRHSPPPAELREGFDGAARAAREFLRALGVADDPKAIVRKSPESIAGDAGVLRALLYWGPDKSACLSSGVIQAYAPQNEAVDDDRRPEIADRRFLVEAARSAAYLSLVAEEAKVEISRKPKRSGPQKEVFSRVLLEQLAECYRQMFGGLPTVPREPNRNGNLDRTGPALKWLREVLGLARYRIDHFTVKSLDEGRDEKDEKIDQLYRQNSALCGSAAEPSDLREEFDRVTRELKEAVRCEAVPQNGGHPPSDIVQQDELKSSLDPLLQISVETLGSKFESAIRRVKRKAATENRESQEPSPAG